MAIEKVIHCIKVAQKDSIKDVGHDNWTKNIKFLVVLGISLSFEEIQ